MSQPLTKQTMNMRNLLITLFYLTCNCQAASEVSEPQEIKISEEQILEFLVPSHRKDIDLLPWVSVSIGEEEKEVARRLLQRIQWKREAYETPHLRHEFLRQGADAVILGRVLNTKTKLDSYVYGTEIYVEIDRILSNNQFELDTTQTKIIKIYTPQNRRVYDRQKDDMRIRNAEHPQFVPGDQIIAGLSRYPFKAVIEILQTGGVPPDVFQEWFYKEKIEDGFEFGGLGVWKIDDNGEAVAQLFGFGPRVAVPAQAFMDSIKEEGK